MWRYWFTSDCSPLLGVSLWDVMSFGLPDGVDAEVSGLSDCSSSPQHARSKVVDPNADIV